MAVEIDVRNCHECPLDQQVGCVTECRHPAAPDSLRDVASPEEGKRDPCPLYTDDVVVIARATPEEETDDAAEATRTDAGELDPRLFPDPRERLLPAYPALENVLDRVEVVNATVIDAELVDRGRGLGLRVEFEWGGCGINYTLSSMEDVGKFFHAAGVTSLQGLRGQHVRVEHVTQASWTPFFRVWHVVDPACFLFTYEEASLRRHAKGERV